MDSDKPDTSASKTHGGDDQAKRGNYVEAGASEAGT